MRGTTVSFTFDPIGSSNQKNIKMRNKQIDDFRKLPGSSRKTTPKLCISTEERPRVIVCRRRKTANISRM